MSVREMQVGILGREHLSTSDHAVTTIGFMGLATPDFLLALILLYLFYKYFGLSIGGYFTQGMEDCSANRSASINGHAWGSLGALL